jgi:hypothetical protein
VPAEPAKGGGSYVHNSIPIHQLSATGHDTAKRDFCQSGVVKESERGYNRRVVGLRELKELREVKELRELWKLKGRGGAEGVDPLRPL